MWLKTIFVPLEDRRFQADLSDGIQPSQLDRG